MKALKITFKSNKLGKICTDSSVTRKTYNLEMAEKIAQRMEELEAADSVDMLLQFQIGRCHPLKGNRQGQFAMDLVQPFRLVFEKVKNTVQIVRFLYKGIIIKHNKTEPTYTKTSLFLCEKRRFLWPGLRKEGNLFKLAGPGGLAFFHLTKKEVSKWPMKK